MIDAETLAQMNGKYVCPPDAGPAWRDAVASGFDMSLIEHSLTLTPEERLKEHEQVIEFLLTVREAGSCRERDLIAVKQLKAVKEKQQS